MAAATQPRGFYPVKATLCDLTLEATTVSQQKASELPTCRVAIEICLDAR